MDGWVSEWMDGWMGRWVSGWVDGRLNGSMNEQMEGRGYTSLGEKAAWSAVVDGATLCSQSLRSWRGLSAAGTMHADTAEGPLSSSGSSPCCHLLLRAKLMVGAGGQGYPCYLVLGSVLGRPCDPGPQGWGFLSSIKALM